MVSNWLLGEDPPAFDILSWNADSTRMPAEMHSGSTCARSTSRTSWRGASWSWPGAGCSSAKCTSDAYVVGAINDHIVPWRASYKPTHLLGGDVRYVLTSGGHIAGIVNPPGPKSWYEVERERPADADEWRTGATPRGDVVGGLDGLERGTCRLSGLPSGDGLGRHPPSG